MAQPVWGASRNFPEFASLAEKQSAVVVNVSATRSPATGKAPFMQPGQEGRMPDWLRRMLPQSLDAPDESEADRSLGSGLVIASDGYVLTNAHVVEGADEILVRLTDRREYPARLVGADRRTDIALLKVDAQGLVPARLGRPGRLRVGDWVLAIGSPFGFDSSATAGIVSAKGRTLPEESLVAFIQTDVAINPGNSGGPLFNLDGEVVGINSQIYSRTGGFMGVSFAIPIDIAMDVQAQLRQRGRVIRGRIGVLVQEVTREMADSFALPDPAGALVSQLDAGGSAEQAGVRPGDVIVRFDGKPVSSSTDLPRIVGATSPGRWVLMHYWRAGKLLQAKILVAEFPEDTPSVDVRRAERLPRDSNRLGLVLQELSHERKRESSVAQGVMIREVLGVAARAELRPGDVVVGWVRQGNEGVVTSVSQFNRMVDALKPGSVLTLLVRRGDSQSFVGMKVPGR